MAHWVAVCRVEEVAEGRARGVEVDGLPLAIVHAGEAFHALHGRCPHAGGNMGHGWVEEGELVCPLHRWRFKLPSGRCTTMRGHSLHAFRCDVRDGQVWVEV